MAKSSTKNSLTNKVESVSPLQEDAIIVIVQDKAKKAKQKVVLLSDMLLNKKVTIDEFIEKAKSQKGASKATLIEAMERASKTNPEIINEKVFNFAIQSLQEDVPRVKWEAAKLISNTAQLFPTLLDGAVVNLLANTEHTGNVVRWSVATALSKIILLNARLNKELIPTVETIIQREEDNAVKKIYKQAIKKSRNYRLPSA